MTSAPQLHRARRMNSKRRLTQKPSGARAAPAPVPAQAASAAAAPQRRSAKYQDGAFWFDPPITLPDRADALRLNTAELNDIDQSINVFTRGFLSEGKDRSSSVVLADAIVAHLIGRQDGHLSETPRPARVHAALAASAAVIFTPKPEDDYAAYVSGACRSAFLDFTRMERSAQQMSFDDMRPLVVMYYMFSNSIFSVKQLIDYGDLTGLIGSRLRL